MRHTILIAEDDKDITELLDLYLAGEGYQVVAAADGEEALKQLRRGGISLALVDIMMPKMNGFELIKELRTFSDIPIIVLSARDLETDRVLGLNIGADAYLTKPFNPLEVVAYVKAALRRWEKNPAEEAEDQKEHLLTLGELELDLDRFQLLKRGEPVNLTSSEFKILTKLMRSPERVFTKAQLYECIGGEAFESDDNTMMVHISNLRSKIEDDPADPHYIRTIRGLGYKIQDRD